MTNATDHYERHLAPIYLWMVGGAQAALQAGRAEIDALGLQLGPGTRVVDLGAGFGMHAIPLAQAGACVLAIDSSASMLRSLEALREGATVRTVCDELLAFPAYVDGPLDTILCMGDSITHLPDARAVDLVTRSAAAALKRGGAFVVSLRDHSVPLRGDQRFIPVRGDGKRLLVCFLEQEETHVLVHDILHELAPSGWTTKISGYRKLRLPIAQLARSMTSAGFRVRREDGIGGWVRLVATRR